jgi:hypothetical protein
MVTILIIEFVILCFLNIFVSFVLLRSTNIGMALLIIKDILFLMISLTILIDDRALPISKFSLKILVAMIVYLCWCIIAWKGLNRTLTVISVIYMLLVTMTLYIYIDI